MLTSLGTSLWMCSFSKRWGLIILRGRLCTCASRFHSVWNMVSCCCFMYTVVSECVSVLIFPPEYVSMWKYCIWVGQILRDSAFLCGILLLCFSSSNGALVWFYMFECVFYRLSLVFQMRSLLFVGTFLSRWQQFR